MNEWMKIMSEHHGKMRMIHEGKKLIVLFDIDGTILDMRYTIFSVLKKFDKDHGTEHFVNITVDDIDFHESDVTGFLDRLGLSKEQQWKVLYRYEPLFYTMASDPCAHMPFKGVFDVIRWFQAKDETYVGLNTGRPELLRRDTLVSLNVLGASQGVAFPDDLLYMRPDSWVGDVPALKAEGIRHFEEKGFRVCAFVDNEPENLRAVAEMGDSEDILLLHADTIFKSDFRSIPSHAVQVKIYDLATLKDLRKGYETIANKWIPLKRTA